MDVVEGEYGGTSGMSRHLREEGGYHMERLATHIEALVQSHPGGIADSRMGSGARLDQIIQELSGVTVGLIERIERRRACAGRQDVTHIRGLAIAGAGDDGHHAT